MQTSQKGEFRARIRPRVSGIYTARIPIDGDVEKKGRFSLTVTLDQDEQIKAILVVTVVRSAEQRRS